jgi:hypothetical protein
MCRPCTPGHHIRANRSLYDAERAGFSGPARFCGCTPDNNNVKERTGTVSLSISSPCRALSLFAKSLGKFRAILWTQNVEYFMNLNAALSMYTNSWTTEVNLALNALIAFYVQLFFCRRLWVSLSVQSRIQIPIPYR